MATRPEVAAGIVNGWVGTFGNGDMKQITDDIVEILRICHDHLTPGWKKAPTWDADELAEAIADYVIGEYSTPEKFSDPLPNPSANPSVDPSPNPSAKGSDDMPPELDIPDQH